MDHVAEIGVPRFLPVDGEIEKVHPSGKASLDHQGLLGVVHLLAAGQSEWIFDPQHLKQGGSAHSESVRSGQGVPLDHQHLLPVLGGLEVNLELWQEEVLVVLVDKDVQ